MLLLHEGDAAVADGLIDGFDGGEAAVGERFVDERPQMLSRFFTHSFSVWAVHPILAAIDTIVAQREACSAS